MSGGPDQTSHGDQACGLARIVFVYFPANMPQFAHARLPW